MAEKKEKKQKQPGKKLFNMNKVKRGGVTTLMTVVFIAIVVVVNVLGIPDILEEFGSFGRYSALVLLAFGHVFFLVYDSTVGNLIDVYRGYFAPKFLRKGRGR